MRYRATIALLLLLFLVACAVSPERQEELRQALLPLLQSGAITQEQFDTMMAAISGNSNWWIYPANTVVTLALAYLGINSKMPLIGRGKRTQVHGLPATKVSAVPSPTSQPES